MNRCKIAHGVKISKSETLSSGHFDALCESRGNAPQRVAFARTARLATDVSGKLVGRVLDSVFLRLELIGEDQEDLFWIGPPGSRKMQPQIWGHELTLDEHWQRVVQVVRAVGVGPESSSGASPAPCRGVRSPDSGAESPILTTIPEANSLDTPQHPASSMRTCEVGLDNDVTTCRPYVPPAAGVRRRARWALLHSGPTPSIERRVLPQQDDGGRSARAGMELAESVPQGAG